MQHRSTGEAWLFPAASVDFPGQQEFGTGQHGAAQDGALGGEFMVAAPGCMHGTDLAGLKAKAGYSGN